MNLRIFRPVSAHRLIMCKTNFLSNGQRVCGFGASLMLLMAKILIDLSFERWHLQEFPIAGMGLASIGFQRHDEALYNKVGMGAADRLSATSCYRNAKALLSCSPEFLML